MLIKIIKISVFVGALLLVGLMFPWEVQAQQGCCKCGPSTYSSSGKENKYCASISARDEAECLVACQEFGFFDYNNPPPGYPIFSNFCDPQDNCPLPLKSCCIRVEGNGDIKSCESNLTQEQCQPVTKYIDGKTCEEMDCESHIGEQLSSWLTTTYTQPEEPPQSLEFTPQVTVPGTIKVGGKSFTVNKGQGVKVDGALLSKYIALVIKWFILALSIVAVAYMGFGGMQWLAAAGNAEAISKAKGTIRDSLIGLVLAATSYVVLYNINSALVRFQEIDVEYIDPKKLVAIEGTYEIIKGGSCSQLANSPGTCNVVPVPVENFTHAAHNALYLQNNKVKNDFLAWMQDFNNETGVVAQVNSMFRTPSYQACLYATLGPKTANKPCTSPHEQGRAVDICQSCLTDEQYNKLKSTALSHNFKVQNPVKGGNESWHFNYTGSGVIYSLSEICPDSQCRY